MSKNKNKKSSHGAPQVAEAGDDATQAGQATGPSATSDTPAASPSQASSAPAIDIGIPDGDRRKIAEELSKFLADAYTLYLKTHNFH
ncbi:MAG TPA: hypothetical protein VLK29_08725, partial [Luteimonas sp.]|nr:hypothetical protein [Luteimonas sp.]